MGKIIAMINQKGGVGKTTTAVNLAVGLGMCNKKVLLIDTDPQYNATTVLGLDVDADTKSIYHVFINKLTIEEVIVKEIKKNVDICPSSIDVGSIFAYLSDEAPVDSISLKKEVEKVRHLYDYIIMDCPPSLGLIIKNCFATADTILIPVQAEPLAMIGVAQVLKSIKKSKETVNKDLTIEGVLVTMFDSRTRLSSDVLKNMLQTFKGSVYTTTIPRQVKIAESTTYGQSIYEYDPEGVGAKAYWDFVQELLKRNGDSNGK